MCVYRKFNLMFSDPSH